MRDFLPTVFVALIYIAGCASSKVDSSSADSTPLVGYKEIATEKFGSKVEYKESPGGRYVLCISEQKGTAAQPRNSVKYLVFDTKENNVAKEENLGAGYVKWFDDTKIETFKTPGIMQKDQTSDDIAVLYDVESGKSVNKRKFLDSKPK